MNVSLRETQSLDITNRYVLDFAKAFAAIHPASRILDFGCGGGSLVSFGYASGLDIYGADMFYGGSKARSAAEESGLLGGRIREIEHGRMNFDDDSFDLIVSNQVFEHVVDLQAALSDINRVLRPGGSLLALFPSADVFREGHIGIPFAHWFDRSSRVRFTYTLCLRALGLGSFKHEAPTLKQWTNDKLAWIDNFTVYRSRKEIFRSFSKYFYLEGREIDYIRYRINERNFWLPKLLDLPVTPYAACALFKLLAFHVILGTKARSSQNSSELPHSSL